MYVLRNSKSNEKLIGEWQEDHTIETMKGGPVFQKSVKCGNNETTEKITMVGCKIINNIISHVYYVFIIPSKFSDSYYVGYNLSEVNDEINEIKLLGFVEEVKLDKKEKDVCLKGILNKFNKTMSFKCRKRQND